MKMTCRLCGQEKEKTEFSIWNKCKECNAKTIDRKRQKDREYYERTKEKAKEKRAESRKRYKDQNRDKVSAAGREYYQANKEKYKENQKAYREKNHEKYRESENRRKNSKYLNDPLYQLKCRARARIYKAFYRNGYKKGSSTEQLIGCTYEELLIHLGPKPEGEYHVDHVVPLAQAQTEEELIKLCNYKNLRWLPAIENITKQHYETPESIQLCKILLDRDWISCYNTISGE